MCAGVASQLLRDLLAPVAGLFAAGAVVVLLLRRHLVPHAASPHFHPRALRHPAFLRALRGELLFGGFLLLGLAAGRRLALDLLLGRLLLQQRLGHRRGAALDFERVAAEVAHDLAELGQVVDERLFQQFVRVQLHEVAPDLLRLGQVGERLQAGGQEEEEGGPARGGRVVLGPLRDHGAAVRARERVPGVHVVHVRLDLVRREQLGELCVAPFARVHKLGHELDEHLGVGVAREVHVFGEDGPALGGRDHVHVLRVGRDAHTLDELVLDPLRLLVDEPCRASALARDLQSEEACMPKFLLIASFNNF